MDFRRFLNADKRRILLIAALAAAVVAVSAAAVSLAGSLSGGADSGSIPENGPSVSADSDAVQEPTAPESHMIDGVEVIPQEEFKAGCETYACTMLLQTLGFDMDVEYFMLNYLDIHWVYYGEDGNRYGPDMHSAQAGDIYTGWGVYSPAMAKYMNNYLSDVGSDKKAEPMEGVPLSELCEKYIANDIPVMVWATTYMMEPYEKDSWIVNYVDENAKYEIGDTFTWLQNEHCLVLIGYDKENYYFADSCAGEVAAYERELTEERYEQLGSQCIVVK